MHNSFSIRWVAFLSPLWLATNAFGQAPAPATVPSPPSSEPVVVSTSTVGSPAPAPAAPALGVDTGASPGASEREFNPGFEGGLRLGIGLPLGNAGRGALGESRKVSDLAPWRAPIWVDIGYQATPRSSYGLYAQFGVGGAGDACAGKCDWSDLRLGAQAQWRLNPGTKTDPWLGLGVGIESLSYQSLGTQDLGTGPSLVHTTERLIGPELLLQGGLELRVEDALQIGPYLAASVGSYLGDNYKCLSEEVYPCPAGSSVNGSGFHAWIGLGLMGRYSP